MDFSNIKLVVTDMDGTLLDSNHKVSDSFYTLHQELKKNNIQFVAASGRPFYSISKKLSLIKNDIIIAAENGAYVVDDNEVILSTPIHNDFLPELFEAIEGFKDIHPVFCSRDKAYIKEQSKNLLNVISQYYTEYEIIKSPNAIIEDIYKIALYHETDSEKYIYPHVQILESKFKAIVSAKNWVDLSRIDSNKGEALKLIQDKYKIKPEETMVFGDYKNDLEMLALAKYSFAMQNAHPDVKKAANYITKTNDENGVEYILKQLIAAKKN